MKKGLFFTLAVAVLISIFFIFSFNADLMKEIIIPDVLVYIWVGIGIAYASIGTAKFASWLHRDEDFEHEEEDEYEDDELDRVLNIRKSHQEKKASGQKPHLQVVHFPVSHDTGEEAK